MTALEVDVVVPTIGRPSLAALVRTLAESIGSRPSRVLLVDDRRDANAPLDVGGLSARLVERIDVLRSGGRGPAAARNVGWQASRAEWIAFLDDDVLPSRDWLDGLMEDLADRAGDVAGSQGVIRVPTPSNRRPTDWERNVRGLETAQWATADLAYRRSVLEELGGFDERFPRAYREDADLGLRVTAAGYRIVRGRRAILHPVRPADRWVSVRLQRGNANDAWMRALHGPHWRTRAGVARGRRPRHIAMTVAAAAAIVGAVAGRRRVATVAAAMWLVGFGDLAWARIAPGPRTSDEVTTMLVTSAVIPFAATWHWSLGWLRVIHAARRRQALRREVTSPGAVARRVRSQSECLPFERTSVPGVPPRPGSPPLASAPAASAPAVPARARRPRAVLFDRDGTLVVDVPYNSDPHRVQPVRGAREALDRLRAAGVPFAVVSNQSGVARGLLSLADVDAVNRRIGELLGPMGPWFVCPHDSDDGCDCRKPAPGLLVRAATALGVAPHECAVIGDTAADLGAAGAVGARGVLVPNDVTRREEIVAAHETAPDIVSAVERLLAEATA